MTYNTGNIIPDTLRSRCIEFNLSLNINEVKLIVNNYFNENIYDLICKDYINYYNSPSFLITGLNSGGYTEIIKGDLEEGDEVISKVIVETSIKKALRLF